MDENRLAIHAGVDTPALACAGAPLPTRGRHAWSILVEAVTPCVPLLVGVCRASLPLQDVWPSGHADAVVYDSRGTLYQARFMLSLSLSLFLSVPSRSRWSSSFSFSFAPY
jgi:hypothetical protein